MLELFFNIGAAIGAMLFPLLPFTFVFGLLAAMRHMHDEENNVWIWYGIVASVSLWGLFSVCIG